MRVVAGWDAEADVSLHLGDTLDLLRAMSVNLENPSTALSSSVRLRPASSTSCAP